MNRLFMVTEAYQNPIVKTTFISVKPILNKRTDKQAHKNFFLNLTSTDTDLLRLYYKYTLNTNNYYIIEE